MRTIPIVLVTAELVVGCACPPKKTAEAPQEEASKPVPEPPARTPAVAPDYPEHDRVEGTSFKNECTRDSDCAVGGCSGEVCSAEAGVTTTCDVLGFSPKGLGCGCLNGQCVWFRDVSYNESASQPQVDSGQGMPCIEGHCREGLTCITYYGVAGPQGPAFTSCEIPCRLSTATCPEGQRCVTLADGPGRVCR